MTRDIVSPLLTRREAAAYLNISLSTLDRQKLPKVKLFGTSSFYEKELLDRIIENCRTGENHEYK